MILFSLLIVIASTSKLCYANNEPTSEDIEETTELVINYLCPLLELNEFTLDDVPSHLIHLTAKYYLIFSRGVEPLDTLEQMVNDYELIQNSQHIVEDKFQEHIEHFLKINASNNKKALKRMVSKILDILDFRLQVVRPTDAVKFLLYQEAYPDIMEIISHMVRKHYNAYLKERAKEKEDTQKPLNSADDVDFGAVVRDFVASHGRLEFLKRFLYSLEQYIPPVDRADISESTLDYLDDLLGFLDVKSKSIWRFINESAYTTITNEWITRTHDLLFDLLTIIPFEEISNLFDILALSSDDRRAFLILRYELRKDVTAPALLVANINDIFSYISDFVVNDFKDIRSFYNTIVGVMKEKVFLKYLDKILTPHNMTTNDFSKEMLSAITRIFTRISSMKGQSPTDTGNKILNADLLLVRNHLEKLRDAIGTLIPEQSESNHIELTNLLQSIVNKFGAFVLEMEQDLVKFFISFIGTTDNQKNFEEKIENFAQMFVSVFESSDKKPSELVKERFLEVVSIIDAYVDTGL